MNAQLSKPMSDLMWTVAQHIYGWTYVRPYGGGQQVAEALVRRGLVRLDRTGDPTITATEAGRAYIEEHWPVSPFILGTYDHQPDGWTPKVGVPA